MEFVILIISGFIGGLIAGLLGLGGGIFYILILPYIMNWYGIPVEKISAFTVANSLMGIAFASGISILSDLGKFKNYLKESLFLGIPAVIISLLTTKYIVQSDWYSVEIFNSLVILLMLFILIQLILKRNTQATDAQLKNFPSIISGSLSGMVSALSGLGGGIIIVPLLQIKFKQSVAKAKIISLVVIFLSSLFISFQNLLSQTIAIPNIHFQMGFILPVVVIPLVIGVIIGSPIGVRLSHQIKDQFIKTIFTGFVILVLIEKLHYFIF